MTIRGVSSLFFLLMMVFATRAAKAGCYDYFDLGPVNCSGANGCKSQWESVTCGFGCTEGTCDRSGNSTECCGVRHDYAQIAATGRCPDTECGPGGTTRVHARSSHVD
jgi:hypothetical protein